jgi:hypothetical protein
LYYIFQEGKNKYYPYSAPINRAKHISQETYEKDKDTVAKIGWKIIRINDDGTKTAMS